MLQHSTWYIGTAVVAKVAFRPGSFSGVDGFARKLRGVDNAYVIPHLPRRDHAVVAMRHVRPSPAQATPILACPRSRCWLLRFFFFFFSSALSHYYSTDRYHKPTATPFLKPPFFVLLDNPTADAVIRIVAALAPSTAPTMAPSPSPAMVIARAEQGTLGALAVPRVTVGKNPFIKSQAGMISFCFVFTSPVV